MQNAEYRVQGFRDLKVWQKSMDLARAIYRMSQSFPQNERYGLTSQIRRCCVSIPSNIAEGSSRRSLREYIRFLNIAHGSLAEAETQLQLANDFAYITQEEFSTLLSQTHEIGKMLNGLINSLEQKHAA